MTHGPPTTPDPVEAMRRLHRRRQAEMSKLVALGHLTLEDAWRESRQLSSLLRRAEETLLGVPYEMPETYHFPSQDLAACLGRHIARLRAGGQTGEADALARLLDALGMGVETLRLPDDEQADPGA